VTTTRRARLGSVALVVGAGLLTGCGVAGTDFHPGVAAEVGDQTLSTDRLDDLVTDYCTFVADNPSPEQPVRARYGYRSELVSILVRRAAVEQAAAQYDAEPGAAYATQVADLERTFATLPEGQQEALVTINEALLYGFEGQVAIGQAVLSADGETEPDPAVAEARGAEVVADWIDSHDIEINPEYGLQVDGAELTPTDQHLSYAAGDSAQAGQADEPDPAYIDSLPVSQRCG